MLPEQDGQLSGDPVRSLEISVSAWAGLYVSGRGLRIQASCGGAWSSEAPLNWVKDKQDNDLRHSDDVYDRRLGP
jgi:hypothetical protein